MTNCMQMEMNALGYGNIHMYALHPGAVATALTSGGEYARENMRWLTHLTWLRRCSERTV